ncbi:hypothetical protein NW759_014966 [Fusarium solani]|nr:hypothetical protein NW759_014966 [Fusarium solani]
MTIWPGFITVNAEENAVPASFEPDSRIRFCHRSVLEFLTLEETQKILLDATKQQSFCPYIAHLKSAVQHLKILPNPLPEEPLRLLWDLVTAALLAANKIDSKDSAKSPAYPALLDQLDLTMQNHHASLQKGPDGRYLESRLQDPQGVLGFGDRGRDYKRIGKMHWSNFHFDPKCSHMRDWKDSFLSLVVQFGLQNYLDNALGQGSKVLKSKKGRPLLLYALRPLPITRYNLITPAVVKTLLNHGANPNERFEKKTGSEHALLWQYETYVVGNAKAIGGSTAEAQEVAEARLEIIRLLIAKGADMRRCVEVSEGKKVPARQVVEECFKSWTSIMRSETASCLF